MPFDGFTEKDFDAYKPAHRTSAMYTLARRQVRDKLKALMTDVVASLGSDVAGMELVLSSDTPSLENNRTVAEQAAYLIRGEKDKTAVRALVEKMSLKSSTALDVATFHKHVALGVALDDGGVRALLCYHPRGQVDRQNLKAKLGEAWAQDALVGLLRNVADDFGVWLPGKSEPVKPSAITVDEVIEMSRQLDGDGNFQLCKQRPRDEGNAGLASLLVEDLRALLPVYRFGAWTPEEDHIQAVKAAKQQREEARKATSLQKGDKVRILAGMWSGKSGVIEAVDKKGGLRVQVGQVTVKVEAKDAAPL